METKEKPKPSPDYLMQLMNDKKLMSSLPNFCGIFNHLERLLDEVREMVVDSPFRPFNGASRPGIPPHKQKRRSGKSFHRSFRVQSLGVNEISLCAAAAVLLFCCSGKTQTPH
uniref:Uncharacterized protein n=1 Tax=Sphaerodactylus townsendi TaxID=933632 RepID=A0ACB8GCP5_9SAUR